MYKNYREKGSGKVFGESFVSSRISDNNRQVPKIKRYGTMCARAIPEMYSYF